MVQPLGTKSLGSVVLIRPNSCENNISTCAYLQIDYMYMCVYSLGLGYMFELYSKAALSVILGSLLCNYLRSTFNRAQCCDVHSRHC